MNLFLVHGAMLVLVLGALAFGLVSALKRHLATGEVALASLVPAFWVVFAFTLFWAIFWNLNNDLSSARLAPIVAWAKGYHFYYQTGSGPLLGTLYGPFAY